MYAAEYDHVFFWAYVKARREGEGESFPGPRGVWGAPPSLKNTENGVPGGFFLT